VSEIANQLPGDIETLRALVMTAWTQRDAAMAERDRALSQIDRLRHLLRQLSRAQFGRRSEKLDRDQLLLALEDIEQAIAESEACDDKKDMQAAKARSETRRANRGALPLHLPRVDVTIAPEDMNCPCCKAPMHVIGEEKSERLDVIPAQFRVIVTHRPKYACRACEQAVVQAPAPERLIKSGLPTEAMVAYVLVAKYAWHLPLYRQAQMLLSQGIAIERATLAFWVGYAAAELKPLYLRLRELILSSVKIAVDETVAPVLDPGRGRTKKGYFWAIARDDRPWGGTDPPAVAYTYAPGRGAVHALKLLETYRGIVQCDGYAAYKTIADDARTNDAITLAFCWAHLRRKFFDIAQGGSAPIASEALERIAALYAIEKTIRGRSADERRAVRKQAGLLRLTTVLAHSSGEWISSEWPVCQISDIASAQRMGAALTYARRYALFTLVGIAGEDDLNAPDLGAAPNPAAEPPRPANQWNGQAAAARPTAPSDGKFPRPPARSVLEVQLSASLRESLIQQMAAPTSADDAAAWARRILPAKNTLTAADAKIVEERFQARLSTISDGRTPDETSDRPLCSLPVR
jgi:transposase